MKKVLLYMILVIFICFFMPTLFAQNFNTRLTTAYQENEQNSNENTIDPVEVNTAYNYNDYSKIRLVHTDTGQIEEINLDEYLCNVVSAEMPVDFEEEALKAQAVVARTYTIYKIINNNGKHENADICSDSKCCQAWISKEDRLNRWEEAKREENWNKIVNAVNSTIGKVITYEGKPINAFFHSNSGGATEIPLNVWGGSGYPYLQVVQTAGEDAYSQYASSVTLTKQELVKKIKEKHSELVIDFNQQDSIKILERTDGNRVKTIKFGNTNLSGVETRTILGLKSANFTVDIQKDSVIFQVVGYGHGVGMSQTGADALAKQGYSYIDIIKHFYVGVEV